MNAIYCFIFTLIVFSNSIFAASGNKVENCTPNLNVLSEAEDLMVSESGISLKGRVDTGAHQSSLHAMNIEVLEENNDKYAQFEILDDLGQHHQLKEKIQYITEVTNTSGIPEKRYVIRTRVVIKNKEYTLDVNLKDRSLMQYKFLIGRDLLKQGGYFVDVGS